MHTASKLRLDLSHLPLPALSSDAELEKIDQRLHQWFASDYAGYRRVLNPTQIEAPDLALLEIIAGERMQGSTGKKIRHFVVLGTGGSSLGAEALIRGLAPAPANTQFYFMDNNDPDFFAATMAGWQPEETLIYAVSKSGSTPETWSQLLIVIEWLKASVAEGWRKHVVLCSDPMKGDFRALAKLENLVCLDIPSSVGGRFSVLTAVGLFPAVFAGISAKELLQGARAISKWEELPYSENPLFNLAHGLVTAHNHRITVAFNYSSFLGPFGRWFAQLWAESLGKSGKGFTPYAAVGTTDQHSQTQLYMEGPKDKVFLFHSFAAYNTPLPLKQPQKIENISSLLSLKNRSMADLFKAELQATRDALIELKHPVVNIELTERSAEAFGALFYFWESVTTYAGALLDIDPFTQPGVERGKILTKQYLGES